LQLRLLARACSAVPTAAVKSFPPKPFRIFSPTSIAMACCHTFRSSGLSGFPHTGNSMAHFGGLRRLNLRFMRYFLKKYSLLIM
jgi:hypothetical protein